MKPLKVAIPIKIEVDVRAYADEYGIATEDVRDDVTDYIRQTVAESYAAHAKLYKVML